jgi:hypothetical protein
MRWLSAAAVCLAWAVPAFADCRSEAMDVIKRETTSGPFRYDWQRKEPNGRVFRHLGIVVPPDKKHIIAEEGDEYIWIGRRGWRKTAADRWEWRASTFVEWEIPKPSFEARVGSVRCLGEVIEDDRRYLAYEYDVASQWDKARISIWRVLTDHMTGLPVRYLRRIQLSDGNFSEEVETRTYEPGLKIEPPVPHFR